MAPEPETLGRQKLAAKVTAAALARGWMTSRTAADGIGIDEATYRAVVNNDGSYRPSDDTLAKLSDALELDVEQLALLRLGVVSLTGDRDLDDFVELLRRMTPEQRFPLYSLAALPPKQMWLVYNFIRELTGSASSG